jgi:hypothetical protein
LKTNSKVRFYIGNATGGDKEHMIIGVNAGTSDVAKASFASVRLSPVHEPVKIATDQRSKVPQRPIIFSAIPRR